jgi:hypothetical protein
MQTSTGVQDPGHVLRLATGLSAAALAGGMAMLLAYSAVEAPELAFQMLILPAIAMAVLALTISAARPER